MKSELQQELYDKYPDLFVNKDKPASESCLHFGIETNDGWYDILSNICWMINQHEENIRIRTKYKKKENPAYESDYIPVKFDQIKEKFGGLRVYYSGGDDYVRGMVSMAESFSYKICEVCGERGKPNKNGWIHTLCEKCREDK
jgi:hypothetical protein